MEEGRDVWRWDGGGGDSVLSCVAVRLSGSVCRCVGEGKSAWMRGVGVHVRGWSGLVVLWLYTAVPVSVFGVVGGNMLRRGTHSR